jgi:hypothetical protein
MFKVGRAKALWLFMLGIITFLALSAGELPPVMKVGMLLTYLFTIAITLWRARTVDIPLPGRRYEQIRSSVRRKVNRISVSESARRAADRASGFAHYSDIFTLLDIGVMTLERSKGAEAVFEITDRVSLDRDALRPYVKLDVPASLAEQVAAFAFQVTDDAGETLYETKVSHKLRAGENLVLPKYQLPLQKDAVRLRSGTWDMTASVNGRLLGIYDFRVTPSYSARRASGKRAARLAMEESAQEESAQSAAPDEQESESAGGQET